MARPAYAELAAVAAHPYASLLCVSGRYAREPGHVAHEFSVQAVDRARSFQSRERRVDFLPAAADQQRHLRLRHTEIDDDLRVRFVARSRLYGGQQQPRDARFQRM